MGILDFWIQLDTVCASAIGNVLFYSASAGLITFGMGLIRQLREIDNGIRKTIDWSNLIKKLYLVQHL